mgnify:CR=1 FL=1
MSRLVNKVLLNRRQRLTARYSLKYTVSEDSLRRKVDPLRPERQPFKEHILCDLLDPTADLWDRRLLYEVTGRTFLDDAYDDDTSADEFEADYGVGRSSMVQKVILRGNADVDRGGGGPTINGQASYLLP